MTAPTFEVKAYPEMWRSLGMDVERFEKMRCVLGDVYQRSRESRRSRAETGRATSPSQRCDEAVWLEQQIERVERRADEDVGSGRRLC